MRKSLTICMLIIGCSQPAKNPAVIEEVSLGDSFGLDVPGKLSEFGFFKMPLASLEPAGDILPYDLNSPLFSDYAFKARFIKLPPGRQAAYSSTDVMEFPEGTVLIKNFYYPADFRKPEADRRIIETRLLIREVIGWNALTYIWNEEQTDAVLEIAGSTVPVSWIDTNGKSQAIHYSVPNLVQCKSCHEKNSRMVPIGPSAGQLNKSYPYKDGHQNQLSRWSSAGLLSSLPPDGEWPVIPVWDDPETGSLAARARAWLDVNCAHCHRREGPAKNTGLYLTFEETDPYKLGIRKPPIAAGRGSGGLKYGIVPGNPDASILVHRIQSLDPGVMMPELGRKMLHEEGITLIRAWIAEME